MTKSVPISFSLDLRSELSDDIIAIAREHGEDPDTISKDIEELTNMIYEKGEFTPYLTDRDYLLKFLRARFCKLDNTYRLLQRYHEFRDSNPELHVQVNPMDLRHIGEEDIVSVASYHDAKGRRMMFHKISNWNTATTPIEEILKTTMMLLELGALEPRAQVLGGIGVFDVEGLSLNHVWYISPSIASKIISLMICMPQRIDEIHIINNGWAFDIAYQIFKPFMTEAMRSRIFMHGTDLESLHRHIPPEHLPEKYGGQMPEFPFNKWIQNLMNDDLVIKGMQRLGYKFDRQEIHDFFHNLTINNNN